MLGIRQLVFSAGLALTCFTALAPIARGQCPAPVCIPPCTTGPDVIVGDLFDVENDASLSGIDALSIGTYACNIGNAKVDWFSDTSHHPVIGGNLYKFSVVNGAGRFEQIGMSWLKHAFFAESDNLCCTDCQGTNGNRLGIHCADAYDAFLNGEQDGLGPRWQVNAHTGVFPYPPDDPPWSGSVARRLEVSLAELLPSNGMTVRYFGEGHYVTQDDAAAGNQNNNASSREMTATPGTALTDWNFGFASGSTTQRTVQAIRNWPSVDPGAHVVPVQVPSGGLYIVGYHATAIGGGRYHYEYAVYNMNDDANAGSFSVPVALGAHVTNIGFHDVTYRDGDGPGDVDFDGTDWPAILTTTSRITWATQPASQNPSANAIRWGTTYNFRFDADTAPIAGTATIGLWAHPGSFTAGVDVPGPGGPSASSTYAYCFGDGSGMLCPCANENIGAGTGCLNSRGSGGHLAVDGSASLSADTLALSASGMPDRTAVFFQGTTELAAGIGIWLGDGLLCVGGRLIRLGTKVNSAGASRYPARGDAAVSVQGGMLAPGALDYQVWYRDVDPSFCTRSTFNLTNAIHVTWGP